MNINFLELSNIKQELQFYKKGRKEVLACCVADRLNKSLDIYYQQLLGSFNYIVQQDELQILKSMK